MHISKRDTISRGKAWTIRAIAILLALIVDGIIIYAIVKMNPLKVYVSLASGKKTGAVDVPAANNGVIATGTVTSSMNLRVRSEPKISVLNQIGSLPTGTKLEFYEIGNHNGASWGRIKFNGKTGWVCMTYVQIQSSSSNETASGAKENGVVANCSVAVNVRDAAKITGRLVTTIKVGTRVAITKLQDGWGLVDGKGWVYMQYVKLDAGAEDFDAGEEAAEITTDPENYSAVVKAMEEKGYEILSDDLAMVPMTTTRLTDPDQLKLMGKLLDALEDNDDVQNVWHSLENEEDLPE